MFNSISSVNNFCSRSDGMPLSHLTIILADTLLTGISWQEFLSAISVTVGGYYAITTLYCTVRRSNLFFKQKQQKILKLMQVMIKRMEENFNI